MTDIVIVVVLAVGLLAVGLRVGMLVAPRLTRWAEREEEEPDDN
jgi:hypothetical protein